MMINNKTATCRTATTAFQKSSTLLRRQRFSQQQQRQHGRQKLILVSRAANNNNRAKDSLAPQSNKNKNQQQQQQQQSGVDAAVVNPAFMKVSQTVVQSQPFALFVGFVSAIAIVRAHKRDKTNSLRKKKAVLRYFDAKGAGEVIRTLFAAAECDYEDFRYKFNMVDDKPTIEKQHPVDKERGLFKANLDRLPILEHLGMSIGQSKTIERYVAKDLGFYGKSSAESYRIDTFTEHVRDVRDAWAKVRGNPFGPPDADLLEKKEKWYTEDMKKWCERLEKVIENGTEGFCVGDQLSLADILLYVTLTQTFDNAERALEARDTCVKMNKVIENVGNLPGIKKWLQSRPDNRF